MPDSFKLGGAVATGALTPLSQPNCPHPLLQIPNCSASNGLPYPQKYVDCPGTEQPALQ